MRLGGLRDRDMELAEADLVGLRPLRVAGGCLPRLGGEADLVGERRLAVRLGGDLDRDVL